MKKLTSLMIGMGLVCLVLWNCKRSADPKDPHVELDKVLMTLEYAGQFERYLDRSEFDKAKEELEQIAKVYQGGIFDTSAQGNFASRKMNKQAALAREDLFSTIRALRSSMRKVEHNRVQPQQMAQIRATIDQLLASPQTIALAKYDKRAEFYVKPDKKRLKEVRKSLRKLSYNSPEQTKFAINTMIHKINGILRSG